MDTLDADGFAPLHRAAAAGRVDEVHTLIERRADDSSIHYENERAIADARLEQNEGNLVDDSGRLVLRSPMEMGGTNERYAWGQSEHELFVRVPVAAGTGSADVVFRATSTSLRLAVHGRTLIDGELHARIIADDATYQIEDVDAPSASGSADEHACTLCVSLTKAVPTRANRHWRSLVRGDPEIDVEQFGEPIVAVNEDCASDVSRYMRIMEEAQRGAAPP